MTDRELMQMVLDAMESFESGTNGLYKGEFAEERKALRDRLAWPETNEDYMPWKFKPPPKREWIDLDHIEIGNLWSEHKEVYSFGMALQKLLKEKNT
jgi:hypothetical protein